MPKGWAKIDDKSPFCLLYKAFDKAYGPLHCATINNQKHIWLARMPKGWAKIDDKSPFCLSYDP